MANNSEISKAFSDAIQHIRPDNIERFADRRVTYICHALDIVDAPQKCYDIIDNYLEGHSTLQGLVESKGEATTTMQSKRIALLIILSEKYSK